MADIINIKDHNQDISNINTKIGDENSGLIKEVKDIKGTVGDKTELPSGDANVIASINRIDSKPSGTVTNEQISQIENNKNALGGLSFKKIDTKEEYDNLPESDIGNPNLVVIKSYEEPITKDSFSLTVGENGEYQFRVNGDIKFSFNAGSGGVIENVIGNILLNSETASVNEESSFELNVSLDKAPTNTQIVTISFSNELLSADKTSLTFNKDNYSEAQSVLFTALADNDEANNECQITFSSDGAPSIVGTVSR